MSDISKFRTSIPRVKSRSESSIARTLSRKPPSTTLGSDREDDSQIILTRKQRMHHTHVIGSTGTGKSKLMELMLRRDVIDRRAGVCLIDPHGSLYDDLVTYVSHRYPNHADRFILFDPATELDNVIGFNPIPSPVDRIDYLLDSLISACLKAWGQDNTDDTPRITRWLENIFYTIIANDLTLVESAPLLNIHAKDNRAALLRNVSSEMVLDDWHTFEKSNVNQKQNLIEGAANRLRKFLRNDIIRNIIGQKNCSLNFETIMDEGKVVLINLNGKGRISHDNAKLLGILIVNEIFRCAKMRDPRDPNKKPFFFYIDEFANFITRDIARSLEETRKFGLFLTLAHQHLSQLQTEDEYLYGSVMTNCKNKIVFGGLSHEDAELMMREVSTGFIDLMKVKDERWNTKERHQLELRTTRNQSTGNTSGSSWSKTIGKTFGRTYTEGDSISEGYSSGQSSTTGSTSGSTSSRYTGIESSYSNNQSRSDSQGRSNSQTKSHSHAESETDSTSNTEGGSESVSHSQGSSESWVSVPEEYRELSSRTFWSLSELEYMETAMIKNQGVAEAFIKVGSEKPRKIKVTDLKDVAYNPRNSPTRISRFRENIFSAHPQYYNLASDVRLEYEQRQIGVFGKPLQFEETRISAKPADALPAQDSDVIEDLNDPFS